MSICLALILPYAPTVLAPLAVRLMVVRVECSTDIVPLAVPDILAARIPGMAGTSLRREFDETFSNSASKVVSTGNLSMRVSACPWIVPRPSTVAFSSVTFILFESKRTFPWLTEIGKSNFGKPIARSAIFAVPSMMKSLFSKANSHRSVSSFPSAVKFVSIFLGKPGRCFHCSVVTSS